MLNTNKAIVSTIVAMIIIAVVSGIIIVLLFSKVAWSVENTFPDKMCRLSSMIKGFMKIGKIVIPNLCFERKFVLDAQDWAACGLESKYEKAKDQAEIKKLTKQCAAKQLANLAQRCWYMYGEDRWQLSAANWDYDCFKIKFSDKYDIELTEKDVTDQLNCDYLPNNDCDPNPLSDGGCKCGGKDAIYWEWHGNQCKLQEGEWWTIKYHDHVVGVIGNDMISIQEVEDGFTCHD